MCKHVTAGTNFVMIPYNLKVDAEILNDFSIEKLMTLRVASPNGSILIKMSFFFFFSICF